MSNGKLILLSVLLFFLPMVLVANEESEDRLSFKEIIDEIESYKTVLKNIEGKVSSLVTEATSEKDFKWKMCLNDSLATIKGISASISSAKDRVSDLYKINKFDDAMGQLVLIRGLADSAEQAFGDAYACQRQLTKVDTRSTTKKEEDFDQTGSFNGNETISTAMGEDFDANSPSLSDGSSDMENSLDTAGTDTSSGGPSETPASEGAESESSQDLQQSISVPPVVSISPEF